MSVTLVWRDCDVYSIKQSNVLSTHMTKKWTSCTIQFSNHSEQRNKPASSVSGLQLFVQLLNNTTNNSLMYVISDTLENKLSRYCYIPNLSNFTCDMRFFRIMQLYNLLKKTEAKLVIYLFMLQLCRQRIDNKNTRQNPQACLQPEHYPSTHLLHYCHVHTLRSDAQRMMQCSLQVASPASAEVGGGERVV